MTNLRPSDAHDKTGRYQLGDVIASGGMGTIRRAYDRLGGREVAYKRLRVPLEASRPRLTALFQREFDTLARLDHPNIVRVYDYGFDEEGPYYTMELLSGEDLASLAPLSPRETCRVLRDLASALALLHARELLHRDISPNNVRLTYDGRAKLIDFGAMMPFGTPREVVGTPAFVAPECLKGEPLDQRTDLYALGALAYWTLTRRPPVRAYSLEQLETALLNPVIAPSLHVPELPPALEELVLSLLQHERGARPTTAADVMERLTRIGDLPPEVHEQDAAFSYLKHPPLRGRSEVIGATQAALEAALAKRGNAILIDGGVGTGRTAVLQQLALEAQLRGAVVLRTEGRVQSGELGVATHLARLALLNYPEVARTLDERSSFHARLNGAEGGQTATVKSPVEAAERRATLAQQIMKILLKAAERSPLVLIVDDADLADAESRALLASLLEPIKPQQVLVAMSMLADASRDEVNARLREGSTRLTLADLSKDDVIALVHGMFGGVPNTHTLALWLHEQSGGNASQCMELVRMLLSQGALRYVAGTFTLPLDLSDVSYGERGGSLLRERIVQLDPGARTLAQLMGLHERSLRVEQLVSASGLPSSEVVQSLARLGEHNIVVAAGGNYALASQALRAALLTSLDEARTRTLHLALAHTLSSAKDATMEDLLGAGVHLIGAGGAEAPRGAELIASTVRLRPFEGGNVGEAIPKLEAALKVFEREGRSDCDCLALLIPLGAAGFYGDLAVQRRYLHRALKALSDVTGITRGRGLARWLGRRPALIVSVLWAVVRHGFRRKRSERRSVPEYLDAFMRVASAGVAAAASSLDAVESERILAWLEPFDAVSPKNPLAVTRDFCIATGELTALHATRAVAAYRSLLERVQQPIKGLKDSDREQLRLGAEHGIAQMLFDTHPEEALAIADRMERDSVFFAPHAETVRVSVYMARGDLERQEQHRARAETLALRGGISWSAVMVLTWRMLQGALSTENVMGLVRATADLERLADLSPGVRQMVELARAHLVLFRGQPEQAIPLYERVDETGIASAGGHLSQSFALFARALNEVGDHERARALCKQWLADVDRGEQHVTLCLDPLHEQLAIADAQLGDVHGAIARIEERLRDAEATGNPLRIGGFHRTLAQIALAASDAAAFERHFAAMQHAFRSTQNPWLIQQCDGLARRAIQAGLRPTLAEQSARASYPQLGDDEDFETELSGTEREGTSEPPRKLG